VLAYFAKPAKAAWKEGYFSLFGSIGSYRFMRMID
jgi:hypothetical protein